MKHTTICIGILFVLLLAACEKPIDFNGEVADPQVVLQSTPAAGDTMTLRLSYSRFFLDAMPFRMISDATVRLSVNGSPVAAATSYDAATGQYSIGYVPQGGDKLEIEVNVAGHDAVSATTTIPSTPAIDAFTIDAINGGDGEEGSDRRYNVRFRLHDDGATDDYYLLHFRGTIDRIDSTQQDGVAVYDTVTEEIYILFGCRDYLLLDQDEIAIDDEPTHYELYFNDSRINGLTHEIQLTVGIDSYFVGDSYGSYGYTSRYDPTSLRLTMYLSKLTRDLYLYRLTSRAQQDEFGSIFSEPTQIHTNVKGGIGIFAGSNTAAIQSEMP